MGPKNKKFNEIKLLYIFFERNNCRKIHGLQVCLVHLQLYRVFIKAPLLHSGFFFSFPISSKYIYEDSLSFIFVIAFSVVMIETKFRNLKGNSGAMENHVYTKDFFLFHLFLLPLNNKEDCHS